MSGAPSGGTAGNTGGSAGSSGGGNAGAGGASGGAGGTGGAAAGAAGKGGSGNTPRVFSQCRFHFGAIDGSARQNASLAAQLDYFTPGWMGTNGDTFDQGYVCDDTDPGEPLAGKIPFVVSYIAAGYAKRHHSPRLNDCNVGTPHLCTEGAGFIAQNLAAILNVYRSFARGYANCYGTTRPIVFLMEPDFYQYTASTQNDPWTPAEAGQFMSQFVGALRESLPNAIFSMDISPWVSPNNGSDHGAQWFSSFDMSLFTFIHTSGGGTDAANAKIRSANNMTWAGVHAATRKPILADTGYGVNGSSAGHDAAWDNVNNINARIANGVVGITQYNPNGSWASTLTGIRSQLATPALCP